MLEGKDMLKKRVIIPALIVLTIVCCSFDSLFKSENDYAKISIRVDSSRGVIQDMINSVTSFNLSVSGPSMSVLNANFTLNETITIKVRAGDHREFTLTAKDSTSNSLFRGTTTEDLAPGEEKSIAISLEKINGLVYFNNNGGTGTLPPPMSYDDAYTIGFPIYYDPVREDYEFTGHMNSESDGSGDFSVEHDEVLSEILFDTNGDGLEDAIIHIDANGVADPGTEQALLEVWPINDITLYAQWDPMISFDLNGGTGAILDPISYHDAYITGFPIVGISPTKSGYFFTDEWNSSPDGTGSLTVYFYGETNILRFDTNNDGTYDVDIGVDPGTGIANPGTEAALESVWPTSPVTLYTQWQLAAP